METKKYGEVITNLNGIVSVIEEGAKDEEINSVQVKSLVHHVTSMIDTFTKIEEKKKKEDLKEAAKEISKKLKPSRKSETELTEAQVKAIQSIMNGDVSEKELKTLIGDETEE